METGRFAVTIPKECSNTHFSITHQLQTTGELQIFCDPSVKNAYVLNDENLHIFFFGAIYNSDHLKNILSERNELSPFELFCNLYKIYGNLAVKFLEGSFFILIRQHSQTILFTDPFSSVPVYSSHENKQKNHFVTNSLSLYRQVFPDQSIEFALNEPEVNLEKVDELVLVGASRLQPACQLNIDSNTKYTYWTLPKEITVFNEDEAIKLIQSTLRKSIAQRMSQIDHKNEKVGVILSGGVDSSIITALATECSPNVSTFCLGSATANEFRFAQSIATHFKTDHHEISVNDQEIIDLIPEVVKTLEIVNPRFVEYLIPIILTYKYAKKQAKYFFNGYGADILFGSYVPATVTPEENYLFVLSEYETTAHSNEYSSHIGASNGIQVFYPYWDKDFISSALRIDPCLKIKNSVTKYILRKAFCDLLPPLNAWRPKSGIHESTGISKIFSRHLGVENLDFSSQMNAKAKYLLGIFQQECVSASV